MYSPFINMSVDIWARLLPVHDVRACSCTGLLLVRYWCFYRSLHHPSIVYNQGLSRAKASLFLLSAVMFPAPLPPPPTCLLYVCLFTVCTLSTDHASDWSLMMTVFRVCALNSRYLFMCTIFYTCILCMCFQSFTVTVSYVHFSDTVPVCVFFRDIISVGSFVRLGLLRLGLLIG